MIFGVRGPGKERIERVVPRGGLISFGPMAAPGHIAPKARCKPLQDQGRSGKLRLYGPAGQPLNIPPHHDINPDVVHFLGLWVSILGPLCKHPF